MSARLGAERIVIVGGGIIGLSIAEHLLRRGHRAVVVEKGEIAREASWASSGFLELRAASGKGEEFFRLTQRSCGLFGPWVERLKKDSGIDPEYVHSRSLDLVFDDEDDERVRALERRLEALGIPGHWLEGHEVLRREPSISPEATRAFFLDHPHQVRVPRLNKALEKTLRQADVALWDHTEVLGFERRGERLQGVITSRGPLPADRVVLAAGAWSSQLARDLHLPFSTRPIRGQALLLRQTPGRLRHLLFADDGYLVPRLDGRLFIGSTEEDVGFERATTAGGISRLSQLALRCVPDLASVPMEASWSGLRPGSADGLPYLGRVRSLENLWVATGHFTHGVVLAPLTGEWMARSLLGESTQDELAAFDPERDRERLAVEADRSSPPALSEWKADPSPSRQA